ncbi:MAG: transcription-repair coupling factor [Candidatus Zixiibacteriota bacterium]|nr:MAG: transcription-repair coupling factor [candidate division Zixibacteria bacterium]
MAATRILKSASGSEGFQNIRDALVSNKRKVLVSGLAGSGKSLLLAYLKKELASSLLVITSGPEESWKIYEDLVSFLGEGQVRLFPTWEILPYEFKVPHSEIVGRRLESLHDLAEGKTPVVVTTVRACTEKTIRPEELRTKSIRLEVGDTAEIEDLSEKLVGLGFRRFPQVEEIGTFSVRGGILDVFPYSSPDPVRIEFFGDQVESIRTFGVLDQRSIQRVDSTLILPKREILISDRKLEQCISGLQSDQADRLRERIRFHDEVPGLEWLASLFALPSARIMDYLSSDSVIFSDEPPLIEGHLDQIYQETDKLFAEAQEKGEAVPDPQTLLGKPEGLLEKINRFRTVDHLFLGERKDAVNLGMTEPEVFGGNVDLLRGQMETYLRERQKVFVFCDNVGQEQRLLELLEEHADAIGWEVKNLSGGFTFPQIGLVVLTDHQIFSRYFWRRRKRRFNEGIALSSYSALSKGDFVVHIDHGIGRYAGLETLEVDQRRRECLKLLYQGEDKLYVPIEEFNRVHRFVGKEGAPTLSKLGGTSWENLKKKTRKAIQDMAQELIQLYAERKTRPGLAFCPDTVWQKELEASFIYEETPDQLVAIDAVKTDMEQNTPADRLVCGDVGYGKTEVAVRAAFKAIMDGKQVAVLVPTTILAQQHLVTFTERLKSFPVNVAMLSRFKSRKEQKEIVQQLKEGKADLVVGTHRLIQKDVRFKDLGLLIIDEEQRFGVAHKEKIKRLRRQIDVITLTATPIPRTLQLSLLGARDMSVINTPPKDRLAIQTEIVEFDKKLVADAVLREVDRGGQVYFVHNRVQTIEAMYRFLTDLVPQIRIAVAHGQMEESLLEKVMLDFLQHRYDMLLVTSIIESGIDIPSVNTIIIDRADRFGLAQLYQLRGRVGRSNLRAYAYLLIPKVKALTHTARKRLKALEQFTKLGSGFHLALRDLEIRGAGNLLGPQQHGFIEEVGFDLYCRLLDEAVKELKGERIEKLAEVKMEFDLDIYIPESYVFDSQHRVEIYRKLSEAESVEEVKGVQAEVIDRFGALPQEVEDLLNFTCAKIAASHLGISRVSLKEDLLTLQFSEDKKLGKKEIENMRGKIELPLEFAVDKTVKLLVQLKSGDKKKTRSVRNLLQSL